MTTTQPSIMITTDEFGFTNSEVGFIKKNFQRKYPAVMGDFIDRVRDLMKLVQLGSKQKLTYSAFRYFPEGSPRYHISESLYSKAENDQRVYLAVSPVDQSRKSSFGATNKGPHVTNDIVNLIKDLTELTEFTEENYTKAQTHTGLSMPYVVEQLLAFVQASKDEAVVQYCEISLDEQSVIALDLSHKASRSHYVQLRFEFNMPSAH